MPKKKELIKPREPAWKGPEVDGVSQSLLGRFLVCKERFRLRVIEGWEAEEGFNAPLEYGNMWHVCEEAFAEDKEWRQSLAIYCSKLCKQYLTEQNQIDKWYNVCKNQFPVYTNHWARHPDVKHRTPLLQEEVFDILYRLPSGRVVQLRGKWDSVDMIGKGKKASIYLQENKAKGRIEEEYLVRQLTFDLQTMIYVIALKYFQQDDDRLPHALPIKGVRYNVIRRTAKRVKKGSKNIPAETNEEFGIRTGLDFKEDPSHWFMRWTVDITEGDIKKFKDDFLDPCLEHLCLWYDYQTGISKWYGYQGSAVSPNGFPSCLHYRLPYGIYNNILEGRGSDIEEFLLSGSTVGLRRVTNLFPELE